MTLISMQQQVVCSTRPAARRSAGVRHGAAWVSALCLVGLAGCSSTPDPEQPGAQVESRPIGEQGALKKPPVDALPKAPVGQPPISSAPIATDKTPVGQLPAVLRDPKSVLSRRSVYFEYDHVINSVRHHQPRHLDTAKE